ncbi:MAG: HDIG domain-containing protein [Candidatus Obscuribacterales bacterium]|nr:HDIG domain-containing protein [Candidatus Obscuribacterales bacterium]
MVSAATSTSKASNYSVAGTLAWFVVVVLSYVVLLLILAGPYFFGHAIKVGDLAEQDLQATKRVLVKDEERTAEEQDNAKHAVLPVLKRDPRKSGEIIARIQSSLEQLRAAAKPAPNSAASSALEGDDQKLVKLLASLKDDELNSYLNETSASAQRLLGHMSLPPYVEKREWEDEVFEFLPEHMKPELRRLTSVFVSKRLETNVSIDRAKTEEKVLQAVSQVKPAMKQIDQGSVIVKKGDRISADQLATLNSMGITEVRDANLAAVIGISLFAAFLMFGIYLYTFMPELFFSPSAIGLMATLCIAPCATAFFVGKDYPPFVPLSAATLILAVTYGRRLAAVLTVLILLFFSVSELMSGANLVAMGTAAGMALGASIKRRRDLMLTGFLIGLMQMVGYFTAIVITGQPVRPTVLGVELGMQMLGGLFAAIAAIGALPFLENIFGILTPYRIAELAEPDQPLMRQLEENAPGTYQHSLAVANLAEGGARAIGADVNLVHTGAMYHDIGKMVTPRYFIENQLGDKNPHDFIPPEESKAKVLAHVTNGLALAQKYGLPKAVQAFIPEHQGTTVMAYFYHKACVRDGVENVNQLDYRYPGPKPQTKESAIVMLADVSEAVTHSMKDPTMEEVESVMSNVFKARWDDGQFSECGLTSDELDRVRKGFVRVWRTLHHDRLKYPSTTTGKMPVVLQSEQQPSGSGGDAGNGQGNGKSESTASAASTSESTASTSVVDSHDKAHEMKSEAGAASEWDC